MSFCKLIQAYKKKKFWAKNVLLKKIDDRNMSMLGDFNKSNKAILLFMRKIKLASAKVNRYI